jgi:hypothetical protein
MPRCTMPISRQSRDKLAVYKNLLSVGTALTVAAYKLRETVEE